MKVNPFLLVISLIVGGMIFLGFHTWGGDSLLYSLGSSLIGALLLTFATAVSVREASGRSMMLKTVSGIFFFALLVADILLSKWAASCTTFIIVNTLVLCVWASIAYGIARAK